MGNKKFKCKITDDVNIIYKIDTYKGNIIYFMIQLVYNYNEIDYNIVRYDSSHNIPHKHLYYKGEDIKEYYEYYSNEEVLNIAKGDLYNNYEIYIDEYKRRYIRH